MTRRHVKLGLEILLEGPATLLQGSRVGLICNQASVNHKFVHAADLFYEHPGVDLRALFGPQHGIRGDVQDNMIETEHTVDRETGLTIHSLYSETREPTKAMLDDVDVLVFDMQDVGCRIYTFAYTMANCMAAARKFGKRVIVCDRPNPINSLAVAGNVLEPEHSSFVGQFPIPTRHGMTLGELALMFNQHFDVNCGSDRCAVGNAFAKHAHARLGNRVSRDSPFRGNAIIRRAGDYATFRAYWSPIHQSRKLCSYLE